MSGAALSEGEVMRAGSLPASGQAFGGYEFWRLSRQVRGLERVAYAPGGSTLAGGRRWGVAWPPGAPRCGGRHQGGGGGGVNRGVCSECGSVLDHQPCQPLVCSPGCTEARDARLAKEAREGKGEAEAGDEGGMDVEGAEEPKHGPRTGARSGGRIPTASEREALHHREGAAT